MEPEFLESRVGIEIGVCLVGIVALIRGVVVDVAGGPFEKWIGRRK